MKIAVFFFLLSAALFSQNISTVYITTDDGRTGTLNTNTCVFQAMVNHQSNFRDIAIGETEGVLIGIQNDVLFEINTLNGQVINLGHLIPANYSTTRIPIYTALVRESPGIFLTASSSDTFLYRIDLNSRVSTRIGNMGYSSEGDLTFYDNRLFMAGTNNQLVEIDVLNPNNSRLVGIIPPNNGLVYGIVSIITNNPCDTHPDLALIATSSNDTFTVDAITGNLTANCTNVVNARIYGAAALTSDELCTLTISITSAHDVICLGESTVLTATPNPSAPVQNYIFEWRVQGNATVISNTRTLTVNPSLDTVYECTLIDTGLDPVTGVVVKTYGIQVELSISLDPIPNLVLPGAYTLPPISGINVTADAAYYTGTGGTGRRFNPGDVISINTFPSFPIVLYAYSSSIACDQAEEDFLIDIIDVNISVSASDTEICEGDQILLTASVNPVNPVGNYDYEWVNMNTNRVVGTTEMISVIPFETTAYQLTVSDSGFNPPLIRSATIRINTTASPNLDPIPDLILTGTYVLPSIAGVNVPADAAYYTASRGAGQRFDPGDTITTNTFTNFPVILYAYAEPLVCDRSEVNFIIDILNLDAVITASSYELCEGEEVELMTDINPIIPVGNYSYEWVNLNTGSVEGTTDTIRVSPNETTTYQFIVSDSGYQPALETQTTVTIQVIASPILDPIADMVMRLELSLPAITGANLPATTSYYTQSGGNGIRVDGLETIGKDFFTSYPATLYAYAVNELECMDELSFAIILDKSYSIIIPKFFTPNNDGYHDTWNVTGSDEVLIDYIYIFDRYGKLLKQISPIGGGWSGTYNGSPVPSSDYWYTVGYTVDATQRVARGHFSLKR